VAATTFVCTFFFVQAAVAGSVIPGVRAALAFERARRQQTSAFGRENECACAQHKFHSSSPG
jgi:hypothetical protein